MRHRSTCFYLDGKEHLGDSHYLVVFCTHFIFDWSETRNSSVEIVGRRTDWIDDCSTIIISDNHQKRPHINFWPSLRSFLTK